MRVLEHVRHAKAPRAPAFVLIVVLVILVAISGLAATLFDNAGQGVVASARARHAPATRAIAESCADRAVAYATAVAAGAPDFDDVLTPPVGTVYLPPGGTTVQVPSSTADAEHAFSYVLMGTGACLVRFDDNSDENKTIVGIVDDADEGASLGPGTRQENLRKDRDRAITVTAIGLHPVGPDMPAADAFDRAPERVTVRRFVGSVPAPAVWAGDALVTGNNMEFCGEGGIMAESQVGIGGGDCVCGDFGVPGGGTPSNCGAACAPDLCSATPTNSAVGPVPNPPAPVDIAFDVNESWGAQSTTTNILGDRNGNGSRADDVWGLYFRDAESTNANAAVGGTYDTASSAAYQATAALVGYQPATTTDVFAWDMTQTFDFTALGPTPPTLICVNDAGAAAACTGAPWNHPAAGDYCANYARDPVERPCNWNGVNAGTPVVVCAEGETPCWKPIARLRDGSNDWNFLGSGRPEHATGGGGDSFAPNRAAALPFFADATLNFDDVNADGGCAACNGAARLEREAAKWDSTDLCNNEFPTPGVLMFDTVADLDLGGKFGGTCAMPLHLTIVVRDGGAPTPPLEVIMQNDAAVTGAGCTLAATPAAGDCDQANFAGPRSDCVVFNVDGSIEIKNKGDFFGRVEADTLNIRNSLCAAGGMTATAAGGDCSSNDGAIQIHNNAELVGTIQSAGDICIKNNATVEGQLLAQDDVHIDNNSEVVFRGGGTGGRVKSVAWIESSW